MPGVVAASPVVEVDAKLAGRDETLRIVGIDVFRAGVVEPALVGAAADPLDTLRPDTLFLTPAALRGLGLTEGDVVHVQSGLADVPLRVAGVLGGGGAQRFAMMDIAGAQAAFGRAGRLSRIDLRLAAGVDAAAFADQLRARLPPGVVVARPETAVAASASLSRSYRVNLQVLALVALFTGGLLVFSTQALAVVRRRAQFALLRVLGVTRRRLTALIVAEGALVGSVGSALGLVLGFALAQLAVQSIGADLGSGYFRGVVPMLHAGPGSTAAFFALGVAAAVLGSLVPALEAARAPPALALKAGDEERAFARLRSPIPGLVALALGAVATTLPPVDGLPLVGYVAIALLLIGTLMLMPRLAAIVLSILPVPRAPAPRLALAQLRGAPGQLTVSLAAIVASVCLIVSMAIMVASFRDSLEVWLERILPADVYVRAASGGDTAFLPPGTQARIAALPGVARVEFLREQQLSLDPARPRIVLLARAVDRDDPARSLPLIGYATARGRRRAAAGVGQRGGRRPLRLRAGRGRRAADRRAARCRSRSPASGATTAGSKARSRSSGQRYVALTGDATVTNGALWLAPGADRPGVLAGAARAARRRPARRVFARRDSRAFAARVRPDVRGHLRARARRRRHRPRRAVVVVRRARARAAAGVRRAAPPRDDAAAGRRDARDRGRRRERYRARRRSRARLRRSA